MTFQEFEALPEIERYCVFVGMQESIKQLEQSLEELIDDAKDRAFETDFARD